MASNIRQILYAGLPHFIDRHTVFPIKYTQAFTVFCIHCILSYSFLDSCYFLRGGSEVSTGFVYHGGTTEEGNCSYLLPRAAAAGSNGTNKGQIHKVPVEEIARFRSREIGMDVTRSQLSANTGIPMCLVREI